MSSLAARLALVVALLFAAVALGATLIPSKPDGVECGSLASPDWTDEQTDDLINAYGGSGGVMGASGEYSARENNAACEAARSTRTTVAGAAAGLAILAPIGVLFVGGGARREENAA